MSVNTDVRNYADAILVQGKHILDSAQSRFDSLPEPAKAEIITDALALLGAIDAAIEALTKRISAAPQSGDGRIEALRHELARTRAAVQEFTAHLPGNTAQLSDTAQQAATKAQQTATGYAGKATEYAGKANQYAGQASETAGKAYGALKAQGVHVISASTSGEGREQLRDEVRQSLMQSLTSLRELRDALARRGERTYAHLRLDPRLAAIFGGPSAPKPSTSNGSASGPSTASRASTAGESTATESASTALKHTASDEAPKPTPPKAPKSASAPKRTTRTEPRKANGEAGE